MLILDKYDDDDEDEEPQEQEGSTGKDRRKTP